MISKKLETILCPECGSGKVGVRDSRPYEINGIKVVRRRRLCHGCGGRFTTVEAPASLFDAVTLCVPNAQYEKVCAERDLLRDLYRGEVAGK